MSRSSQLVVAVARAIVEAAPLALAASVVALLFQRVPPALALFIDSAAVLVFWAAAGPVVGIRARLIAAGATAAAGGIVTASAVGGFAEPAWPAALLAGALYATTLVWRGLAVAATAASWRAAAWSGGSALVAIALAALLPHAKDAIGPIAIACGVAGTIALSTARGIEETFASDARGEARRAPGSVASILVGLGALALAAVFPQIGRYLHALADVLGPYAQELLILLVTPFVYLADAILRFLLPLLRQVRLAPPTFPMPPSDPAAEAEYARQLSVEAAVFLQRFFFALAVLVVVVLIARVVLARVALARAEATIEREAIEGESLGAMLGHLTRRVGAVRRSAPTGTDALARVRRAYWDLLRLAERAGPGWRAPAQTPREHARELTGDGWRGAGDVVAAFERARYAERASEADAEGAERAVRDLEAALSSRA